jgi:ornithine cyclodeaminase/alanine dehydrogenase
MSNVRMARVLDDETVRAVFDWSLAIAAVHEAYTAEPDDTRFPGRTMARGDHGWLRTLSGVPAAPGLMGLKLIAAAPGAGRVSYLITLFDQRTAELVAVLDGHSVTGYRTAATSALVADALAGPGPLSLAVIGSGFEARSHVRAVAAVRDLEAVQVYSPRSESRAGFVAELADLPVPITAAESAEAAVEAASLVICAARSRDETPTLRGAWLRPGVTVVSIGSTLPEQREVDAEVLARSDFVVADALDEVLEDTGDLIAAREAGIDVDAKSVSLADLLGGRHPGRTHAEQIALYKSVGSAVQDLAVAAMCVQRAARLGLGAALPVDIAPVRK